MSIATHSIAKMLITIVWVKNNQTKILQMDQIKHLILLF